MPDRRLTRVSGRAAGAAVLVGLALLALFAGSGPSGAAVSTDPGQAAVELLIGQGAKVFCGGADGNAVALTFDDGPGAYTGATLDLLRHEGAAATFFDVGSHVIRRPGLVRRAADQGVVGDHSWSHPDLRLLPSRAIFAELARTQQAILKRSRQTSVSLFRPPYGALDDRVTQIAARLHMLIVLWSVYSGDTLPTNPAAIAGLVEAGVRPGSIVLLHENAGRGTTLAALPQILNTLASKGLKPVTLPQLLAVDPPTARQLHTGPYGCGPTLTGLDPAHGPTTGGTLIKISGDQLSPANQVFFGKQPAQSLTVISTHELEAVSPPGSGTVHVTATTHFGTSPTSTLDSFSYGQS